MSFLTPAKRVFVCEAREGALGRIVAGLLQREGYQVHLITDRPRSDRHDLLWGLVGHKDFRLPPDTTAVVNLASENVIPTTPLAGAEAETLQNREAYRFAQIAELVAKQKPFFRPQRLIVASSALVYPGAVSNEWGPAWDESFRGTQPYVRALYQRASLTKDDVIDGSWREKLAGNPGLAHDFASEYLALQLPPTSVQKLLRFRETLCTRDFERMNTFSPEEQEQRLARWQAICDQFAAEAPDLPRGEIEQTAAVELLSQEVLTEEERWAHEQAPLNQRMDLPLGLIPGQAWNASRAVREIAMRSLQGTGDVDVSLLRFGNILQPDAGPVATSKSWTWRLAGRWWPDSNPEAPLPWIHVMDAARAVCLAVAGDEPLHGPVNVVAPQSPETTYGGFLDELCAVTKGGARRRPYNAGAVQNLRRQAELQQLLVELQRRRGMDKVEAAKLEVQYSEAEARQHRYDGLVDALYPEAPERRERLRSVVHQLSDTDPGIDGSTQTLLGTRVVPARLQQLGFEWEYPELRPALESMVGWRSQTASFRARMRDYLRAAQLGEASQRLPLAPGVIDAINLRASNDL